MRGLLLAGAALALAACQSEHERQIVNGMSNGVFSENNAGGSRDFAQSAFTAIELNGSDDVEVTTGPNFSVSAKGPSEVLDNLEITTVNGVLQISRKKDSNGSWLRGSTSATIHVVMPRLERVAISGSGDVTADRAEGDFQAAVAGSGSISVKQLTGGSAKLSVGGSGDIELSGRVDRLSVDISGSGSVDADDLVAQSADVSVAGAGDVEAQVKSKATITVSGSGNVRVKGGAQCTITKSGSGGATCS